VDRRTLSSILAGARSLFDRLRSLRATVDGRSAGRDRRGRNGAGGYDLSLVVSREDIAGGGVEI